MKQKKELTPEEKKRANKVALFGCLPIIIIGIALIFFASTSSDKKKTSSTEMAYIISQNYVKNSMNFPSESDFPFYPKHTAEYKDNVYYIVGEVTGKNAFGVEIKHTYYCTLQYLGGDEGSLANWSLKDLKFD